MDDRSIETEVFDDMINALEGRPSSLMGTKTPPARTPDASPLGGLAAKRSVPPPPRRSSSIIEKSGSSAPMRGQEDEAAPAVPVRGRSVSYCEPPAPAVRTRSMSGARPSPATTARDASSSGRAPPVASPVVTLSPRSARSKLLLDGLDDEISSLSGNSNSASSRTRQPPVGKPPSREQQEEAPPPVPTRRSTSMAPAAQECGGSTAELDDMLGSLAQLHMPGSRLSSSGGGSRNGGMNNPEDTKVTCAGCKSLARGRCVIAAGQTYHLKCFVCSECAVPLDMSDIYAHGGRVYCESHFEALCLPVCHACESFIEGDLVRALGKTYHPEHFCCSLCKGVLESGYLEHEGQLLCDGCYVAVQESVCHGCNLVIGAGVVQVRSHGRLYHPDCYRCHDCAKSLEKVKSVFTFRDLPMCIACMSVREGLRCMRCGHSFAKGDQIRAALNHRFHKDCFTCGHCKRMLQSTFDTMNGDIWCTSCAHDRRLAF